MHLPFRSLSILAICFVATSSSAVEGTAPGSVTLLALDKPLLAQWPFDEPAGVDCPDASGNQHLATPLRPDSGSLQRVGGLFGGAMHFAGPHILGIPEKPDFDGMDKLSFSAWIMPTDVRGYREIFRKEDGDRRVLFALQGDGTILSLGLNVGGYVECDAPIKPAGLVDGLWHHCAATFDGKSMRVYLDGRQVGVLARTGTITAGGSAPGCIGSSNGGENFQGVMDELCIYSDALSAEEIRHLYQNGIMAMAARAKRLEARIGTVYVRGKSFAETMARSREQAIKDNALVEPELINLFTVRLKADFPEEYARWIEWSGKNPAEYLSARDHAFLAQEAERMIGLLIEYKPLTEAQWAKQSPEQHAWWKQAEQIEQRLAALKAEGPKAAFSPAWIELILSSCNKVPLRPYRSEAVAPYILPSTPPLRELTAAEAAEALQRDWLHQAGGNPTPERIGQEIGWARQLATRLEAEHAGAVDFSVQRSALDDLAARAAKLQAPDAEIYFAVRRIKRTIAMANPVVDFERVLLVDMPFPAGSEWPHETRHRLGYMAVPGGQLLVLNGLSPAGKLKRLMPQAPLHGSFWRPDLSYDGKTVVFCFKPHNEKAFHLYEINVDGTGVRQLTDGQYDDFDPIYVPDGEHVVFSTTRSHTYVRCMPPTNAYVLARCDRDGNDIYLISRNNEPDYLPSVMNDGRIIYTRWEYTDKPLWRAQSLWVINPDGTQVNTFWGNQSVWPDLLKDARSIPGSRRVMFTGSAHHNWFSGSVGIIDPVLGYNFPDGLTKVTADLAWPESGNGPVDPIESAAYHASGHYAAYYSPYPLSERDFLVSANRQGKFVLYLMDVDGNRELIHEGTNNIFHALPIRPRPKPPVLADRVTWPTAQERNERKQGVIYSAGVYEGAPEVLRGKAKYLRIMNIDPKTYTYWHKRPYISTGPVVSMVQSEGIKRVLGTVPIEADGSVAFHAPAGMALHFQLLDENYLALQTMRSFSGVMPGEKRGCKGCHKMHSTAPRTFGRPIATTKDPRRITPPPWEDRTVGYHRYVQPVLDKYCGKCHQGDEDAKARTALDLTVRPGFAMFDEPYVTLIGSPSWGKAYQKPADPPPGFGIAGTIIVEGFDQRDPAAYQTIEPMTTLSYRSKLIELCSSGKHYDVKVDPVNLRRLAVWIDAICPYRGEEEVRAIEDPEFQGVDWLSIRPKIKTAPVIVRPGPLE